MNLLLYAYLHRYLHHQKNNQPYDTLDLMSQQLIKAAGLVSEKLDIVTEALGKIPVFEVLNELKRS